MNSKTIIKRTLPLIIALFVIIVLAVSCTIFSKDKKSPSISNPNDAYLTAGDIVVKKGLIYDELKTQKGLDTLLTMIDRELLMRTKNKDGVNFYDSVSEEKINEAIEEAMFPNGRSDNPVEDDKVIDKWLQSMAVGYGLRTEAEMKAYYRLNLAKEAYARYRLQVEYEESIANNDPDNDKSYDDDIITSDAITNYYDNNYKNSYWAIIVPFNTVNEAEAALSQLGIVIKKDGNGQDAWFWGNDNTELSAEQIKQAFIDLYNNVYSYKAPGYPNANPADNVVLGIKQYTIVDSKIVFNTDYDDSNEDNPQNLLYFTNKALNDIYFSSSSVSMAAYLKSLDSYMADGTQIKKAYSIRPKTWSSASKYYFVFKINHIAPEKQADVKEEIITKLLDDKNTEAYRKTALNKLRKDNNILIYDPKLEASYISTFDSTHSKTKKESLTVVAELTDLSITADMLFNELSKKYGVISSFDYYANDFILYSDYNKIYDYKNKKVLDEKEWKKIADQVDDIKTAFKANAYYNNGYGVSYGWENFLRDYYRVKNAEELKIYFLRQAVTQEFVKVVTKTEDLWLSIYEPQMTTLYDNFLSATGVHLLISKKDDKGNLVEPSKWTAYEKQVAEELYDSVLNRLATTLPSKYQTLLENTIMAEYKNAPKYIATLPQDSLSQPVYSPATPWVKVEVDDYLYSKAKTANLDIKFESLTISAGQMVSEFEAAVRAIWNKAEANNSFGSEPVIYDKTYDDYLVTKFGYHVYVNLTTTNRTTIAVAGVDTVVGLPTQEQVVAYEKNDADPNLTTLIKKSITTYFNPVKSEIKGEYFYRVKLYEYYLTSIDDVSYADPNLNANGELEEVINYQIDSYYSSLKYVKNPKD